MTDPNNPSGGGATSFLFQGQPPPPAPTGSSTSSAGPLWLQDYIYNTLGAAQQLAGQPYQQFPGPTVAAPSGQTQQAWQLAGQNVGNYQPYLNQAGALTAAGSAPITGQDISTFLNPFQNYITGAMNTNLQQNILPGIQDKFVSAGQSRSPQEAELTNQAVYNTNQAIGQSLGNAYQGALGSLLQSRGLQQAGGAQYGQLGALSSQLGTTDVGQLAAAGQAQDQLAQANINSAMQQFQQQQNWPYQNIGFMSDIARGLPVGAAGTTSQTVGTTYPGVYQPSPLATFGSVASQANSMGMRRGGHVGGALARGYAGGGVTKDILNAALGQAGALVAGLFGGSKPPPNLSWAGPSQYAGEASALTNAGMAQGGHVDQAPSMDDDGSQITSDQLAQAISAMQRAHQIIGAMQRAPHPRPIPIQPQPQPPVSPIAIYGKAPQMARGGAFSHLRAA